MSGKGVILIVDDEPVERQSLVEILKLEGFHVHAVGSGPAAVDFLRHNPVDLMILDLRMPGMNGLEVIKAVDQIYPHLAIILLTAYGSMETAIEALRWRVHDYLLKPASAAQIVESVGRGLAKRRENFMKPQSIDSLEADPVKVKLDGGVEINFESRLILVKNKAVVSLTPAEGRLLKILIGHPEKVFTHRELVLMVQGYATAPHEAPEILRPLVSRLRQKCGTVPGLCDRIISVRGTGYYFSGDVQ